jgi:hypothetical protein
MRNAPSQRLSLACLSRVLLGVSSFPTEYILRYLTLLSSRPACPLLCCSALSFVLSIYILSLAAISSLALLHIIITVPCGTYYHSHLSTFAAICTSASIRSFNRNRSPSAKPLSPENRCPEIAVYLIATDTYILNYHTHLEHTLHHTTNTNLLINLNRAHNSHHPRLEPHQPPPQHTQWASSPPSAPNSKSTASSSATPAATSAAHGSRAHNMSTASTSTVTNRPSRHLHLAPTAMAAGAVEPAASRGKWRVSKSRRCSRRGGAGIGGVKLGD